MTYTIKIPSALYNPSEDIRPGDIILLNMNPNRFSLPRFLERLSQKSLNEEGGHQDIEHAGVCINLQLKNDQEPKKYIVHLMGRGFLIEPIEKVCNKKTVHVYRPKNDNDATLLANKINEVVREKKTYLKQTMRWSFLVAFFSHVRRLLNSVGLRNRFLKPTPISKNESHIATTSICTKLVADLYKEACRRASTTQHNKRNLSDEYMNIYGNTLPKTLQAYLARNINYTSYIIPHARENIYEQLNAALSKEIKRLQQTSKTGKLKAKKLNSAMHDIKSENLPTDPFEKAIRLLKTIKPILQEHRNSIHLFETKSFSHINSFLKTQGLYAGYYDSQFVKETKESLENELNKLNYTSTQKLLYYHFRQLGRSDREARFEVQPSLSEWVKQNPYRIAAASMTGLGFFAGVIPYAICKLAYLKHRNAEYNLTHRPSFQ